MDKVTVVKVIYELKGIRQFIRNIKDEARDIDNDLYWDCLETSCSISDCIMNLDRALNNDKIGWQ